MKTYEESNLLRTRDCDVNGEWRFSAILETLQETAAETIYSGIRDTVPFLGEKAFRWICGLLGRLTCKILVRFNAIPVNRNNPGRLISTMRRSV